MKFSISLDRFIDLSLIIFSNSLYNSSSIETEEDIIKLNHHKNLQPLCSKVKRYILKSLTINSEALDLFYLSKTSSKSVSSTSPLPLGSVLVLSFVCALS